MRKKYLIAVSLFLYLLPAIVLMLGLGSSPGVVSVDEVAVCVISLLGMLTYAFGGGFVWLAFGLQFAVRNRPLPEGAPRRKPLSLIFANAFAWPTPVFPLFWGLCYLDSQGITESGLCPSFSELSPLAYGFYAHFIYAVLGGAIFIFGLATRDAEK